MKRDVKIGALLTLLVVTGSGCEEDCPRRLSTRVSYTGAQRGGFYSRELSPAGVVVSFGGAPRDTIPPGVQPVATTDACWEAAAAADDIGYLLEGWVDLDGEDQYLCRDFRQTSSCGPDSGEPQGQIQFTVKAAGTTEVELLFGDP